MSGTGHTTKTVVATGDQFIDGLIGGVAWDDAIVYYSFPANSSEYTYSPERDTLGTISSMQEYAARMALDTLFGNAGQDGFSIEGFTNVSTVNTANTNAHLRLAETNTLHPGMQPTAWAYAPYTENYGGDVWFYDNYRAPEAGNYDWATMFHEIGHAMGLKHGHDMGGYGALPSQKDSMEYSIMTYRSYVGGPTDGYTNENWGYAQSFMMADIAALQAMYGADYSTNSGDTVYKWSPGSGDTLVNGEVGIDAGGNRIFATVWDGGGTDTYDLSAYSSDLRLDLAPGGFSKFSDAQLANLGNGNFSRGNIFNALLFNNDSRSLIENALGGSGNDHIEGNRADNFIKGNKGNDTIKGFKGDDDLRGNAGNDRLFGGDGNDKLRSSGGQDKLKGGKGDDKLYGGGGKDTLDGGKDNDKLVAGSGNDKLLGGSGKDTLNGGKGNDRLWGDGGNDKFVFKKKYDKDKIMDFQDNRDTIQLSDNLWSGTKSVNKVLNQFGSQDGSDFLLDFGGGDILIIKNTTQSELQNDIDII